MRSFYCPLQKLLKIPSAGLGCTRCEPHFSNLDDQTQKEDRAILASLVGDMSIASAVPDRVSKECKVEDFLEKQGCEKISETLQIRHPGNYFFTGQSCSGKTTAVKSLVENYKTVVDFSESTKKRFEKIIYFYGSEWQRGVFDDLE